MFKNISVAVIILTAIILLTGCDNLLEDYRETITEHQAAPYVRPPTEQITVSNFDEFITTLINLIMDHETSIKVLYEGEDVQAVLLRAGDEIMHEHPIGVYAVANITLDATRIVTHFEVDIEIEYKRTKEQLDSIVTVATELSMRQQLLSKMSEYVEEAVFRTRLRLDEEIITEFVRDIYYQNPHLIVMLPIVTVEIFPEEGSDRIYEIKFGNMESPMMMQRFGELLTHYIQRNAQLAFGSTDPELLLSLVSSLMSSTDFNEGASRTIHVHGAQNLAATAFGALIRGNAVGEGFAMAFKALADELGFDCRVVLGHYDGMIHAWNIVLLYGDFYHIDVAMCVVNGLEAAFLKTDEDFEDMYSWDRENTVICEGELTLDDIPVPEDPDEPDDPDGSEDQNGESNNEEDGPLI